MSDHGERGEAQQSAAVIVVLSLLASTTWASTAFAILAFGRGLVQAPSWDGRLQVRA
jgi:hypothetical protein